MPGNAEMREGLLELGAVAGGDAAVGYVLELFAYHLLADGGDVVGEEVAVQMAQLVLDHAAAEAVEGLGDFFEVFVVVFDCHGFGAADVGVDAGDAQAALVVFAQALAFGNDDGID